MDLALVWNDAEMAFDLGEVEDGDLAKAPDLETAVPLSIHVHRRADDADLLRDPTDRRGWWADGLDGDPNERWGSRVWQMLQRSATAAAVKEAEAMIRESLQWLIDDGVAGKITVEAEIIPRDGSAVDLGIFVDVRDSTDTGILSKKYMMSWEELQNAA